MTTTDDRPATTCPAWCQAVHVDPADPHRPNSRLHVSSNHIAMAGSASIVQWNDGANWERVALEVTVPDFMSLEQAEDFAEMILELVRQVRAA